MLEIVCTCADAIGSVGGSSDSCFELVPQQLLLWPVLSQSQLRNVMALLFKFSASDCIPLD